MRKGFNGPSRCSLCMNHHETIDHLLDACPFTSQLWDLVAGDFRRTNRVKGNITETLKKWTDYPFESNILNQLWNFTPGFVLWSTWKERNSRIFKNTSSSPLVLWKDILKNLHETLYSKGWSSTDLPTSHQERRILRALNFDISIVPAFCSNPTMRSDNPS